MAYDKWHPLKELETMKREMDRIWEDIFPARRTAEPWKKQGAQQEGIATPAIDVIDTPEEVVIRAEMPGVTREDIEISLQENTLTIKGEIKTDPNIKEGNYAYSERNYRYFARSLNIPFKISQDRITATLKDGLLNVRLPKILAEQPKKITVEVS